LDWVLQDAQLMVHASTTHPDELLLLPELFEELLPELPEEELEELPETGDLLDGAMTPAGIFQPLLTPCQRVSVSRWILREWQLGRSLPQVICRRTLTPGSGWWL